jgi:RimJ/RimL family protein N-acetyltransferase
VPGLRTIETERLLLRPLRPGDLDGFAALNADPQVAEWIGGVRTREETETWLASRIETAAAEGYGHLSVLDRATGAFLGRCGLSHWEIEGRDELEVGYALVRSAWGHGYATEAAVAVRDHALNDLGKRRLIALVAYGNERSAGVAGRLGMSHERDVEWHERTHRLFALSR